jgi:hypothetical protein
MRRALAPVMLLVLAVLHAPTQAQAVVFSLLPDILSFGTTSEPAMLFMTGIALLSLAAVGTRR